MADRVPRRRKNRWRRRAAVAVGTVVVLGTGGYAAYAQVSTPSPDSTYRLATVGTGSVSQFLMLTGTVKRVSQVTAAFPVSGSVTGVSVGVGDTVTAGQQLATIDQTPLQAAVTDAQAQLLTAQAQLTTDQTA
ncbi:MAG: biotin/lipoyl-binding protein, partial [Actinomycetota bacterium]|nr:biotin/lipoyl-binding protein [Actinomycetota bacterium]